MYARAHATCYWTVVVGSECSTNRVLAALFAVLSLGIYLQRVFPEKPNTGVIAILFFLTCALKYTCLQKCPLLYSKVQRMSFVYFFCCSAVLLT